MTETSRPTTRGRYRPRYQRARVDKPPFDIKTRDLDLLAAIWGSRFLTLSLANALFPPDSAKTPAHIRRALAGKTPRRTGTNVGRRLAALYHYGYLDRIRTIAGSEVVYALAQRGARLLRERQPELAVTDTDWAEKNRTIKAFFVEHALMVARLRVALIVATRQTPTVELTTFLGEAQAPRRVWTHAGRRAYVNPDALFILRERERGRSAQAAFLVEADRSTEVVNRLRQKFALYSAFRTDRLHREPPFSLPGFRVLTICRSNERALNLLKLAAAPDSPVPPEHRAMFLFTTEETYAEEGRNTLAAIWRSADDPRRPRALIASPLPRL